MEPALPLAGTAVVLRDGADGLETLMLRRPRTGSFADAWVFPGGKVEPADGGPVDGAPANGAPVNGDPADAERDIAGRAAVRETLEETGIRVDGAAPLSLWTPPAQAPVRIRTWFFVARDLGDPVRINPGEIVDAVWCAPGETLRRHAAGELVLFPPTWVTLHGLTPHASIAEVYAALGEPGRFATRVAGETAGTRFLWRGDEDYPDASGPAAGRHRLDTAELPWRYERS